MNVNDAALIGVGTPGITTWNAWMLASILDSDNESDFYRDERVNGFGLTLQGLGQLTSWAWHLSSISTKANLCLLDQWGCGEPIMD